ncbi:hypothetical protein [Lentzea sp. NPDC092896]|uniref:hypothetical protein n=1 Tax=Lentzea sp. NPDC092896 TaxID=3364127 RepID=UPI0038057150
MKLPQRAAIDTNVLIVANGKSPQASDECELAAIEFLEVAESDCVVLIDDGYEIFEEYKRYCNFHGQPGVGDHFFMHLHRSQADASRVHQVRITADGNGSYAEVPAALAKFDPSDKKFIATVLSDGQGAPIVNCVDSDWSESSGPLLASGVHVHELCPASLKETVRKS